MRILFSTGSLFYLPLKEIFLLARRTGFDGCDLVIQHHLDRPRFRETIEECLQILPVYALHAPFHRLDQWGNQIEALIKCIALAKEYAIPVVNFHPPSWIRLEVNYIKWFRRINDFQKELDPGDVVLAVETMPLVGKTVKFAPNIVNNFKDMIKVGVEKNLCFTFDTTHVGTFECDIIPVFIDFLNTGRLKHIHLSDYADNESHLFPGRGKLPIVKLLNTARALGYNGAVSLEISPTELPATRQWLIRALSYAAAFLKMHAGREESV